MIIIHSFFDWTPSIEEFVGMLNVAQIGASQECDVTIGTERKTMKEWQKDPDVVTKLYQDAKGA